MGGRRRLENWEEINLIASGGDAITESFGWPCYEGSGIQNGYDGLNLSICEALYYGPPGVVTAPFYAYHHNATVVAGEACPTGRLIHLGPGLLHRRHVPHSLRRGALLR